LNGEGEVLDFPVFDGALPQVFQVKLIRWGILFEEILLMFLLFRMVL
jgi:hypothetical protein